MRNLLLVLATALLLSACGGGGGGSMPSTGSGIGNGGGNTPQNTQESETAIDAANSLGDPVKSLSDYNQSISGIQLASRPGHDVADIATNTCVNGVEFFSPDKNNDPNSTEEQYFYDTACMQLARDVVRIYAITGDSESVNRTEKQYALNNPTATAQRTTSVNFIDATFGTYGYPVVADGFARSATSELDLAGAKTLLGDDELIVSAGSNGTNAFCGDSAGYNATGIAALNETFGWQGLTNGGTRTVNGDGSVTWQSTHTGNTAKGAIGSLGIASGVANTTCPISAPEYVLAGGAAHGSYSIPVNARFFHGELTQLTVSNATLSSGDTLNVTTNTSVSPPNTQFINGVISNGSLQVATFSVNTFGDGTLTVTSSGTLYIMNDWHVVK